MSTYAKGQVVSNDGSSYICTVAHTSSGTNEPGVGANWTDYWDLLVSKGDAGAAGAAGEGVAAGGTTGQVLAKASDTDYDTEWITASGTGTVTSVGLSVPTGLSVTGSPVTTTGTLAITTSLSGLVKGTGSGFAAAVAGTDYLADITGESLSDLSDVTITSIASGEILKWNGSAWINNTLAEAGIAKASAERVSKAVSIESPTNAEDISLFYTTNAITVTKLAAVLVGSSTPSVTWTIRHSTDRSATGNEVVTLGTTTTSTTTGSVVTSFNDETIPAGSYVWLETTAQSGTVDLLNVTIEYSEDA